MIQICGHIPPRIVRTQCRFAAFTVLEIVPFSFLLAFLLQSPQIANHPLPTYVMCVGLTYITFDVGLCTIVDFTSQFIPCHLITIDFEFD